MVASVAERAVLEGIVDGPISAVVPGRWGFTNPTDIVALANDECAIVQRYRRQKDAAYRLHIMQRLHNPAAQAGITMPAIHRFDLDADPHAFGADVGRAVLHWLQTVLA